MVFDSRGSIQKKSRVKPTLYSEDYYVSGECVSLVSLARCGERLNGARNDATIPKAFNLKLVVCVCEGGIASNREGDGGQQPQMTVISLPCGFLSSLATALIIPRFRRARINNRLLPNTALMHSQSSLSSPKILSLLQSFIFCNLIKNKLFLKLHRVKVCVSDGFYLNHSFMQ